MKLFGLGGCKHVDLKANEHVTNKHIKNLAAQLKSISNAVYCAPSDKNKSDIKSLQESIRSARAIVSNNPDTHNSNKASKIKVLAADLRWVQNFNTFYAKESRSYTLVSDMSPAELKEYKQEKQRTEEWLKAVQPEMDRQREADKRSGAYMGGMVK